LRQPSSSRNNVAKVWKFTGAVLTTNTTWSGLRTQTPLRHLVLSESATNSGLILPSITSIGPDCVAHFGCGSAAAKSAVVRIDARPAASIANTPFGSSEKLPAAGSPCAVLSGFSVLPFSTYIPSGSPCAS